MQAGPGGTCRSGLSRFPLLTVTNFCNLTHQIVALLHESGLTRDWGRPSKRGGERESEIGYSKQSLQVSHVSRPSRRRDRAHTWWMVNGWLISFAMLNREKRGWEKGGKEGWAVQGTWKGRGKACELLIALATYWLRQLTFVCRRKVKLSNCVANHPVDPVNGIWYMLTARLPGLPEGAPWHGTVPCFRLPLSLSLSWYPCVLGSFRLQFYVGTRLQAWIFIIVTLCRQFAAGCRRCRCCCSFASVSVWIWIAANEQSAAQCWGCWWWWCCWFAWRDDFDRLW